MNQDEEDKILRDLIISSSSNAENVIDAPTELSLYDTIKVLEMRNINWRNDEFARTIFIWQSKLFHPEHVEKVCNEKCPELLSLCEEYSNKETINGNKLHHLFGLQAIEYIMPHYILDYGNKKLGCDPVRKAYFEIKEIEK